MDIKKLISEIIPHSDYQHRNGFSKNKIIDKLNDDEKTQTANELMSLLLTTQDDMLIVETLGYMRSKKSLPILKDLLKSTPYEMSKIIISSAIYEINHDNSMIEIALAALKKLPNIYYLTDAFFCLVKFNNPTLNDVIKEYTNHPDNLVSFNAKRALEMLKSN